MNRRDALAGQSKRILVDAGGVRQRLSDCTDEVAGQFDNCQAFDKAPHLPVAGAPAVFSFNEKAQVGLLYLGDIIAFRGMDMHSMYSLLVRVCSGNPLGVSGALSASRISVSGRPRSIQTSFGGGREKWRLGGLLYGGQYLSAVLE